MSAAEICFPDAFSTGLLRVTLGSGRLDGPEVWFEIFAEAADIDDDEADPVAIMSVRLHDLVPLSRALLGTLARFAESDDRVRDAIGGVR